MFAHMFVRLSHSLSLCVSCVCGVRACSGHRMRVKCDTGKIYLFNATRYAHGVEVKDGVETVAIILRPLLTISEIEALGEVDATWIAEIEEAQKKRCVAVMAADKV